MIQRRLLIGAGAVAGLVVIGSAFGSLLTPPTVQITGFPLPVTPTPGVTGTPPSLPATEVTVTEEAPAATPMPEAGACDPEWKKRLRRLSAAVGIKSAESAVVCCGCYGGTTMDASNIAKNTASVSSLKDMVTSLTGGNQILAAISGGLGVTSTGQFGATSSPLTVVPAPLSSVMAIATAAGLPTPPTLTTSAAAASWLSSTFYSSATDTTSTTGIANRRTMATEEAANFGYALAARERSDQSLQAENSAFVTLGNSPGSVVGQIASLGNAAASIAADTQHLTMMEEASLEILATQALTQSPTGGFQ